MWVCPEPECDARIRSDPTLRLKDQMHTLTDRIRNHIPYYKRNHDNDPYKPEESHRISPKKPGDSCRCGGMNPSCPRCGGNGIIP
jgi:hypothetical protein